MPLLRSQVVSVQAATLSPMSLADGITAAELYERYMTDILRYVVRRVATPEEAEDITAEVFTAAFVALQRFRGQCSPYLWLLTIARRKIIDAARRRAARRETLASELADERPEATALWEAVAAVEGPEAAVMRLESRRVLQELMAQLKPDQKEAFLLHYMERLSAAEIAEVMGRSVRAVYGLLHRARESLRRRGRAYFLDEEGGKTNG